MLYQYEHLSAIETYIVDAFTNEPFKGNPAGVCVLEQDLADHRMLSIARELGLSETAFIQSLNGSHRYAIRFFSPKMEIPLCGHATLASAKIVFSKHPEAIELHFINVHDLDLVVRRNEEQIIMEFPVYDTQSAEVPAALLDALGIAEFINGAYNAETHILLVEIADSRELAN